MTPGYHESSTPRNVSVMLVADNGCTSMGTAAADKMPEGWWWVSRVLVDRRFRGKGIGRELVARMLRLVGEQGGREIRVAPGGYDYTYEEQAAFYQACGFQISDEPGLLVYFIQ